MLSPGKYHLKVPKEPLSNLRVRLGLLKAAETDERIQRGLWEMCKNDILFFINLFIIQINPDTREKGPFITWPYQDVAIKGGEIEIGGEKVFQDGLVACVEDREDVRWPKSREGGASWIVLMTIVWLCIFHDNAHAGAISRDEDSVDSIGNPNSLFEKVRVMLQYLPDWMKGTVKSKKMAFQFDNGNTFTGEANVASANVGGRLTILLIDEFGQFDKNGEAIYDFTRDASKCRVFVFTHKDQSGMAFRLCYDSKFLEMREIITHWSQHPMKNKGLYKTHSDSNEFTVLDRKFDFNAICFHGIRRDSPEPCSRCKQRGFKAWSFVQDGKPIGGPCPGIRSVWYDIECRKRNERDVTMNLDIDPRGASDIFFDAYRIGVLKVEHGRPPKWQGDLIYDKATARAIRLVENPKGLLKLWFYPKSATEMPVMKAGAGVDVAAGSGASPSCLSLGNARTGEKAGEYANANIYGVDFATFAVALLRMFRDEKGTHPLLVWEIQGSQAFERRVLEEFFYSPVLRNDKGRAGWNPDRESIMTLMEEYRDALYMSRLINRSEPSMDETLNFVYTTGGVEYRSKGARKRGAADGSGATIHHGDMVRADALMHLTIKDLGFERLEKERQVAEGLDPRTFDGRTKLVERQWQEAEDEEWV